MEYTMISKTVKTWMLLLGFVICAVVVRQQLTENGRSLLWLYAMSYSWLWFIVWLVFATKRVIKAKAVEFKDLKQDILRRSEERYSAMSPAEQADSDRRGATGYKTSIVLVGLGTAITTFLINPIGGAMVSYRIMRWVSDEWRSTNAYVADNIDKRAETRSS